MGFKNGSQNIEKQILTVVFFVQVFKQLLNTPHQKELSILQNNEEQRDQEVMRVDLGNELGRSLDDIVYAVNFMNHSA